jgi:putative ABC transport system substrate-binding protein
LLVRGVDPMSYDPNQSEMFDSAANLAARILKRMDPGRLLLAMPRKFVLPVNLMTAETIGVTIPPPLSRTPIP